MSLEAIKFKNGRLEILDQLKLPFITEYITIDTIQDGWVAINEMKVSCHSYIILFDLLGY
jgi:methylthioribose-1-phosphate isomerase